eukprot:CAMPEP_0197822796 /NCGR_PEP_ID=MMETSP1437-20131217/51_1 /TAXON_ID=49252 ORGANISM="Eucampia antarctica, Strain CCMP1452" /NCGR_SAMPLE_ID=MMETSP1437 /ASSEMBLY_ACC=CAM_ASM_001096 /LENGTH=392 /DNA_ID=CAMNT_0043421597 /DNA_START=62 /DNA_END=1240 /DNA_ORIENTATION=+
MKTTSAILSLLFAQNVNAFAPVGFGSKTNMYLSSTISADVKDEAKSDSTAKVAKSFSEDSVKYTTDVDIDQKFKIVEKVDEFEFDPNVRVQTGRYNDREMSVSVPFLKRPTNLDGTHAGDIGFDPLGLSEHLDLYTMMESEVRHSRLAMLAVVGWPLAELLGPNWMLHGPNHISPSVLNGFDPLSFIAVAGILGGLGFFEYKTSLRRVDDTPIGQKHKEDMKNVWRYGVPGDYNFDPLNWYNAFGDTATGRKAMRELEIGHGRWAMVGITAFAAWEALTGHPIVENSMFFHPNALLPFLTIAYFAFGFFYDVKNSDQYLFQIEMNSEGEARKENLQRSVMYATEDAREIAGKAFEKASGGADSASDIFSTLKEKYNSFSDGYTEYSMRNIEK